jgi:hypothetical protein
MGLSRIIRGNKMILYKMVNGESVPLDEEDLKQREIDEARHQENLIILNSWQKKREFEYIEKIDPFLLTALSEHYLDSDSTKLNNLKLVKDEIKQRIKKEQ